MKITTEKFGNIPTGEEVTKYTMTEGGYSVSVLNYGGIVTSMIVPDRDGKSVDVVLGFDNLQAYRDLKNYCYLGAIIGRCANRIAGGTLKIAGNEYRVECNEKGINHLHGGSSGLDKKLWKVDVQDDSIVLSYTSPDGEEGYPGNLEIQVIYKLENGTLTIAYRAVSDKDTICNLSNHSYFNLAGHDSGSVGDQLLRITASFYARLNDNHVPTGEITAVEGTPMDLRIPKRIDEGWDSDYPQLQLCGGYDHHFFLDKDMGIIAEAYSQKTGISMEVITDMSGLQLYTGNFLGGMPAGKGGVEYSRRCGFCLETQYPPNAINIRNFEQPLLKAGEVYEHTTIYRFGSFPI